MLNIVPVNNSLRIQGGGSLGGEAPPSSQVYIQNILWRPLLIVSPKHTNIRLKKPVWGCISRFLVLCSRPLLVGSLVPYLVSPSWSRKPHPLVVESAAYAYELPISLPVWTLRDAWINAHFSIDSRWFAQGECGKSTSTNGHSLKLRSHLLSANHSAHSATLHAMFKVKRNWQYVPSRSPPNLHTR